MGFIEQPREQEQDCIKTHFAPLIYYSKCADNTGTYHSDLCHCSFSIVVGPEEVSLKVGDVCLTINRKQGQL